MHIAVSSASYEPVRQAVAVATTSVLSAPARGGHVKNEPFQPVKKRGQTSQKLAQTKKPPSVLSLLGLRLPEEGFCSENDIPKKLRSTFTVGGDCYVNTQPEI